jgi:hypothetical protein
MQVIRRKLSNILVIISIVLSVFHGTAASPPLVKINASLIILTCPLLV